VGESVLRTKSYGFAINIIKVYKQLITEQKEFVLSKQLLKSGTAVGALIREAEFAQSKADFINKLSIALKESNETEYWILLMRDSDILTFNTANILLLENKELIGMLVSSIKTTKLSIAKL
jgi:four helix bundle protein